jgi:type II secretory pathway pseudopilin PulG
MNLNINAVKGHAKTALMHLKDPWTLSWIISGLLAVLIPVIIWSVQRGSYYNAYGYANEVEEQQRQYYQNQNDDGNNNNNNNNNNNSYYSTYKECSWFNWPCRKRQYYYATMDSGDGGDDANENGTQQLPNWYLFLGGLENSEEMSQWKEENTGVQSSSNGPSAGIEFVYVSTLLLFTALFAYGAMTIGKKQSTSNLVVFLVVAASVGLMNLVGSAQGIITSDDRDMEDSYYGWYGQMGVLIVYTDFWIMLFSIGYLIAFRVRSYLNQKTDQSGHVADEEATKYQKYDAPKTEIS